MTNRTHKFFDTTVSYDELIEEFRKEFNKLERVRLNKMLVGAEAFAKQAHVNQVRKYTGEPYHTHLQNVVNILNELESVYSHTRLTKMKIFAWLHDTVEDCDVSHSTLNDLFGLEVADSVGYLTDCEQGNRATRKALARVRLGTAPADIQTIKVADLLDNTASIFEHDPKFAAVYYDEAVLLLDALHLADEKLKSKLRQQLSDYHQTRFRTLEAEL